MKFTELVESVLERNEAADKRVIDDLVEYLDAAQKSNVPKSELRELAAKLVGVLSKRGPTPAIERSMNIGMIVQDFPYYELNVPPKKFFPGAQECIRRSRRAVNQMLKNQDDELE